MKMLNALVAVAALSTGVAMANEKKDHGTPNCEVGGKKSHVKDKAACDKKKGKWMEEAAPAAAPAADATAPAAEAPHK